MGKDLSKPIGIDNSSLSELRAEIDALTLELYSILDKRLGVVKKVGELKSSINSNAADFYRADREALMVAAMKQKSFEHLPPLKAAQLLKEIISMCLSVEAVQSVAFVQSTTDLSAMAAMDRFGHQAEFHPCQNLTDALQLIRNKQCCHGVFPITTDLISELINSDVMPNNAMPSLVVKGRIHIDHSGYQQDYLVLSLSQTIPTESLDKALYWIDLPEDSSDNYQELIDCLSEMKTHANQRNIEWTEIRDTNQAIGFLLTYDGISPSDDIQAWLQQRSFSAHFLGHYPHFDSDLSTAIA